MLSASTCEVCKQHLPWQPAAGTVVGSHAARAALAGRTMGNCQGQTLHLLNTFATSSVHNLQGQHWVTVAKAYWDPAGQPRSLVVGVEIHPAGQLPHQRHPRRL